MCWLPLSCPCIIIAIVYYSCSWTMDLFEVLVRFFYCSNGNPSCQIWINNGYTTPSRCHHCIRATVCELSMRHLFKFNINSQSAYLLYLWMVFKPIQRYHWIDERNEISMYKSMLKIHLGKLSSEKLVNSARIYISLKSSTKKERKNRSGCLSQLDIQ